MICRTGSSSSTTRTCVAIAGPPARLFTCPGYRARHIGRVTRGSVGIRTYKKFGDLTPNPSPTGEGSECTESKPGDVLLGLLRTVSFPSNEHSTRPSPVGEGLGVRFPSGTTMTVQN